jgi:hypothetical protein
LESWLIIEVIQVLSDRDLDSGLEKWCKGKLLEVLSDRFLELESG